MKKENVEGEMTTINSKAKKPKNHCNFNVDYYYYFILEKFNVILLNLICARCPPDCGVIRHQSSSIYTMCYVDLIIAFNIPTFCFFDAKTLI